MDNISPTESALIIIFSVLGLLIIMVMCLRHEKTIIDEVERNRGDYRVKSALK